VRTRAPDLSAQNANSIDPKERSAYNAKVAERDETSLASTYRIRITRRSGQPPISLKRTGLAARM